MLVPGLMLFTSNVYISKSVLMKIEVKIKSWGKQNRDFDLEAILGKVAISAPMLEIEPGLVPVLGRKSSLTGQCCW